MIPHRRAIAAALGLAALLMGFGLGASERAQAGQTCGRDDYWCSSKCGAWNNWCRPACGDWNGWCAGQSLPGIVNRLQPRSYFAYPTWYGQNLSDPWYNPELRPPPPKAKLKARKAGKGKYASGRRAKRYAGE
jgi:hypothetical protein